MRTAVGDARLPSLNTAIYGTVLARYVGIGSHEDVRDVARGGLVHDIGKNRIPRAILDKPAALDPG